MMMRIILSIPSALTFIVIIGLGSIIGMSLIRGLLGVSFGLSNRHYGEFI